MKSKYIQKPTDSEVAKLKGEVTEFPILCVDPQKFGTANKSISVAAVAERKLFGHSLRPPKGIDHIGHCTVSNIGKRFRGEGKGSTF